jgi:acyl-CoA thioester hydrolase
VGHLGIEAWRGGVNPWQCDQMGHLNVRFYVAHAMEALAALASSMGMPRAFAPRAVSTLMVREHHIRFLKEARAGEALHMEVGLLEVAESEASVLQVMRHSDTAEPAAVFHTRVAHVRAPDAQPFAWSSAVRAAAERLRVEVPEPLRPRSLIPGHSIEPVSLARAESLPMIRYGAGAFTAEDADAFGRVGPHRIMGRMGDGSPHEIAEIRAAAGNGPAGQPLGVAVVEYRLVYLEAPEPGDRYEIRSGLSRVEPKRLNFEHWILDPDSGRPWAIAEVVLLPFDIEARKAFALSEAAQAALKARLIA